MEKSKLKLKAHMLVAGEDSVEVWYEDTFIAAVYGADGPGVRVISKHPMDVVRGGPGALIGSIEVRMEVGDPGEKAPNKSSA
jgi:hypothetical protein